jgi:hypothetical protein
MSEEAQKIYDMKYDIIGSIGIVSLLISPFMVRYLHKEFKTIRKLES